MTAPVTRRLAGFAAAPVRGADAARAVLRLSLLDWIAVTIAGRDEPVARILRGRLADEGGKSEASALGLTAGIPARAAALVNGTASHALDYDDTHFAHIGHPSVAVIPAALAMAERQGTDGAAFLDAALVGVEASIRVGQWLGRDHYQAGFHQTATAGAFGASLAAGRLLGLDADALSRVIGLAATRASGLKSQFGTMAKPFHAGMAASNGIEAALLVADGFVPNPDGLECAQGFGPTHAGQGNAYALDDLGQAWRLETVSHKFHACCHGLHAMLEAAADLPALDPSHVAHAVVTTHPRWLAVCNIAEPATGLEAKFSYRLAFALALSGARTGALDTWSDASARDPGLNALRDRVEVQTDDALPETAARLRIDMVNGTVHRSAHDLEAQLPHDQREAKIRHKAEALLGPEPAAGLWAAVQGGPELAVLTAALRAV